MLGWYENSAAKSVCGKEYLVLLFFLLMLALTL